MYLSVLSWFKMLLLLFCFCLESYFQNPRVRHCSRARTQKSFLTILISALNRKSKQTVSNESRNVKLVCLEKSTRVTVTRFNKQGPSWWMFTTLFWEPIILFFFVQGLEISQISCMHKAALVLPFQTRAAENVRARLKLYSSLVSEAFFFFAMVRVW